MCINKKRHQRLVISKEKDMIRKMKNKTKMTTYAKKKRQKKKKTGVINLMINNMCIKKKDIKGLLSVKRKIMVKKMLQKEKDKMTSFPAPGIEP